MLVDVAFKERDEDLPDPVAHAGHLPERNKLANVSIHIQSFQMIKVGVY